MKHRNLYLNNSGRYADRVADLRGFDLPDMAESLLLRENELMAERLRSAGFEAQTEDNGRSFRYIVVRMPGSPLPAGWATADECQRLLDTAHNLPPEQAFGRWLTKIEPLPPAGRGDDLSPEFEHLYHLEELREEGELDDERYNTLYAIAKRPIDERPDTPQNPVIIQFVEGKLTDNGRWLLNLARGQSAQWSQWLEVRGGVVFVPLWARGRMGVSIRLRSLLSWAERARQFGIDGVSNVTDEYIANVVAVYGEDTPSNYIFYPPYPIVTAVRQNRLDGASAWNMVAEALREHCEQGKFEPVVSDDWITQSAAAELVGMNVPAITQAIVRGLLPTWVDSTEPNPRRQTRVSRSAVLLHWKERSKINPLAGGQTTMGWREARHEYDGIDG